MVKCNENPTTLSWLQIDPSCFQSTKNGKIASTIRLLSNIYRFNDFFFLPPLSVWS